MINTRSVSIVRRMVLGRQACAKPKKSCKNVGSRCKTTMPSNQSAITGNSYCQNCEESGVDVVVDLRSDTVTRPSKRMREVIANAVVGDDVFDEDPTTKDFENRISKLLDKEAALLVPSGTMGNLICGLVHCNERGSELICGDKSHIFLSEQGNISQFGGIHSRQMQDLPDGTFCLDTLKQRFRPKDKNYPVTKVVFVENTHNRCGGRVLPLEWLDKLAEICKAHEIPIHMDGARLFNASIASGVPVNRIVRDMASVSICLSKGLGAPIGSVIVGSMVFIEQARRLRKAIGGGMRQVGIISAAGIYCLDNMIARLKDDHENARRMAEIINALSGGKAFVNMEELETNMAVLHVKGIPIAEFCKLLSSVGNREEEKMVLGGKNVIVKCFPWSANAARLALHCDISTDMAELAARKIAFVASKLP